MEELRLKFLHQKNWIHLVFGIAFLLLGFTSFFIEDSGERNWFFTQAWPIPFGLIYIWLYFYQRKNHSIIISSNSIKSQLQYGRTIKLEEITRIKFFAGDYTVFKGEKKITIPTQNLKPEQKDSLKEKMQEIQESLAL